MSQSSDPPSSNAALIEKFYAAFAQRDAETMAACYHPDIEFSDPAFPNLQGEQAGDMWRMLCGRAQDLEVEWSGLETTASTGRVHWQARYTFSGTGRKVHNRIDASFEFENGLIRTHRDRFDLWAWAGQALGLKGKLLGWTPMVRKAIQAQAGKALMAYRSRKAEGS